MKMKDIGIRLILGVIVIAGGLLFVIRSVSATPGSGVTPQSLASGQLPELVRAKFKVSGDGFKRGFEVSRVEVVKYTVSPGGYFGWHQHGGPVMVAIAAGELTFYEGDDPTCTGAKHPAGTGFFETGDHTHYARNEGNVDVVVYATFMLPQGAPVRIDAPNPGVCPF